MMRRLASTRARLRHSQVNAGTRFHIVLPVTAEAPTELVAGPAEAPADRGTVTAAAPAAHVRVTTPPADSVRAPRLAATPGRGRIFVVEDEAAVRELVRRALSKDGYEIRTAASAEDALEQLEGNLHAIDLLITDLVMPGINGHVLSQRLRSQRPDLKVVLMSGYSEEQVRRQTAADDDLTLLRKPFTVSQLAQTVAALTRSDVRAEAS
jgi:two-component system cell cycle sensor histidine kinase/response regulator CckA